jgi:hypothetical protein
MSNSLEGHHMSTPDDYAWFEHDDLNAIGFCITFVRDLSPEEALQRLGVPAEPWTGDVADPNVISAATADGGSILIEVNGFAGTSRPVAARLSAGTRTASVSLNLNLDQSFVHAVDGQVVTVFEPDYPSDRSGALPDLLLPHMLDLGMPTQDATEDEEDREDWGDPVLVALALAERVTGVRLTREALEAPSLTGSSAHLY